MAVGTELRDTVVAATTAHEETDADAEDTREDLKLTRKAL